MRWWRRGRDLYTSDSLPKVRCQSIPTSCAHSMLSSSPCIKCSFFQAFFNYNLGQGVGDKLTNLSKIGFSIECFTADFFAIFYQKVSKIGFWVDGWVLAAIFFKFPNFLRSWVIQQLVYSLSGDNHLVSFHFWWRQIVLKSEIVYTFFVQDCRPRKVIC